MNIVDIKIDSDHFHVYQMRNPSDKYKFERDILLSRLKRNVKKRGHKSPCSQVIQYNKLLKKKAKENKPILTLKKTCNCNGKHGEIVEKHEKMIKEGKQGKKIYLTEQTGGKV